MDKVPQPADSQQQNEKPKKQRKPWPMRWVILFILSYLAIYTYWRLK
ncbi:MAG: hypothetical protein O7C75_10550 [Verrucomicrobia bacterium]|nr:hypothetical protein [Verrucomicrobiota bacterium]